MPNFAFNSRQIQALLSNCFVCLFKPRDISMSALERLFLKQICAQANELDPEPAMPLTELPVVEEHWKTGALVVVGKRMVPDLSLHPLVVGRMFRPEEFRIEALSYMEPSSSGVCLFGLNSGCDELEKIRDRAWLSEYWVDAQMGRETHQHSIRGKVNSRMEYDHVTQFHLSRMLSIIRMQFKRTAFEFANVDLQSQEAFELARRGAPRPKVLGSPLVYDLQLRAFKPPMFMFRLQCTGENEKFLRELVHEIGCCLNTTACPRRLRRIRQGPFSLDHALLEKHFHLETVVKNALMCGRILKNELQKPSPDVLEVKNAAEEKAFAQDMLKRYHLTPADLEAKELPEDEDCLRLPFGRDYHVPGF